MSHIFSRLACQSYEDIASVEAIEGRYALWHHLERCEI